MEKFFNPKSVAVLGASRRRGGYHLIRNLLFGYGGRIYPVSSKYPEIEGIRCYESIDALPEVPDLLLILVPAAAIPDVIRSCWAKGIDRVMIQSAGFAEIGDHGRALQQSCMDIARGAGIRLWGPNCMGLVDVPNKRLFTFMQPEVAADGLISGRISLVVQSGMLAASFLNDCNTRLRMGVAKVCSIGNKADLDECDFLEYLLDDPQTEAVALYLESIKRGRRFTEIASRARKPIVVLKSGRSKAGSIAAESHTSSLAGNSRLSDGVLQAVGVTMARDFSQMMEMASMLAFSEQLDSRCRVAILTFSGGAGVVTCDLMEEYGLPVAVLAPETRNAMGDFFPDWMPISNPVDLYPAQEIHGRVAIYNRSALIAIEDPNTDVVFIHFVAGREPDPLDMDAFKAKADENRKIVVVYVVGPDRAAREVLSQGQKAGIMVFRELGRAVECLAAAADYRRREWKSVDQSVLADASRPIPCPMLPNGPRVWDEYDSKKLLAKWDVPVAPEQIVKNVGEAVSFAARVGYPIVLKGLSEGQVHKTEKGLVRLNLSRPEDVKAAFTLLEKTVTGTNGRILAQHQVDSDYELIVGFVRDAQFGPILMFGLGGIFSELQKDVSFTLAPLDAPTAVELMGRIRGRGLLNGFRGTAPLDKKKMARLLVRVGEMGAEIPEIDQIDLNPVIVNRGAPVVVDATVILSQPNRK